MIQYYTYLAKDGDCRVYKSINDRKKYRFLKLDNGLKVFIIQDERRSTDDDDRCDSQDAKRVRLSTEPSVDSSTDSPAKGASAGGKTIANRLYLQFI